MAATCPIGFDTPSARPGARHLRARRPGPARWCEL